MTVLDSISNDLWNDMCIETEKRIPSHAELDEFAINPTHGKVLIMMPEKRGWWKVNLRNKPMPHPFNTRNFGFILCRAPDGNVTRGNLAVEGKRFGLAVNVNECNPHIPIGGFTTHNYRGVVPSSTDLYTISLLQEKLLSEHSKEVALDTVMCVGGRDSNDIPSVVCLSPNKILTEDALDEFSSNVDYHDLVFKSPLMLPKKVKGKQPGEYSVKYDIFKSMESKKMDEESANAWNDGRVDVRKVHCNNLI